MCGSSQQPVLPWHSSSIFNSPLVTVTTIDRFLQTQGHDRRPAGRVYYEGDDAWPLPLLKGSRSGRQLFVDDYIVERCPNTTRDGSAMIRGGNAARVYRLRPEQDTRRRFSTRSVDLGAAGERLKAAVASQAFAIGGGQERL